jgi:putative two-component system protein, hydrogenase maturation factor HypX/HoxX
MAFRIALVYSGFGGMAQALWAGLRDDGHEVVRPGGPGFRTAAEPRRHAAVRELAGPDVIFCPFLKEVVPPTVCEGGPRGSRTPASAATAARRRCRGRSSTARRRGASRWCGPSHRSRRATSTRATSGHGREFPVPPDVTVGELYAQQVTPAALACTREVLDRMRVDPGYVGVPLAGFGDEVQGRFRPALTQGALAFSWEDHPEDIARRIRAATFGVRIELAGQPVNVFDAHPHDGDGTSFRPGAVVAHRDGALLVGAGQGGALWIGHANVRKDAGGRGLKLPAVAAVGRVLAGVRERTLHPDRRRAARARTRSSATCAPVMSAGSTPRRSTARARPRSAGACSPRCATPRRRTRARSPSSAAGRRGITASTSAIEAAEDPQAE